MYEQLLNWSSKNNIKKALNNTISEKYDEIDTEYCKIFGSSSQSCILFLRTTIFIFH
jgi:hypothetical protein